MIFLFISGAEIVFIFFIILMVFGADKIPDIAKGMAQGIRKVKDATQEIKSEIKKSAEKKKNIIIFFTLSNGLITSCNFFSQISFGIACKN